MNTISASDVQEILKQWAIGNINETQVHAWAEERYATSNYEPESEAVNEVLARLDMMDMNLTTPEDIPTFVRALQANDFNSILAEHDKSINIAERREKLRHVPLYARFCE